jgi:hypothetical protein
VVRRVCVLPLAKEGRRLLLHDRNKVEHHIPSDFPFPQYRLLTHLSSYPLRVVCLAGVEATSRRLSF